MDDNFFPRALKVAGEGAENKVQKAQVRNFNVGLLWILANALFY